MNLETLAAVVEDTLAAYTRDNYQFALAHVLNVPTLRPYDPREITDVIARAVVDAIGDDLLTMYRVGQSIVDDEDQYQAFERMYCLVAEARSADR